jgi:hypothetical protein
MGTDHRPVSRDLIYENNGFAFVGPAESLLLHFALEGHLRREFCGGVPFNPGPGR